MKYYIKLVTGFREDQYISIPMQEAHKAYYLFTHPEERGVFSNGMAIIGKNIQEIKPDWNATMGYNQSYQLNDFDYQEINTKGVNEKMKILLEEARDIANLIPNNPQLANKKLGEIIEERKLLN